MDEEDGDEDEDEDHDKISVRALYRLIQKILGYLGFTASSDLQGARQY